MKTCKELVPHISRLEGQLASLKKKIEAEDSCTDIVRLALSAAKSFDSLKAKLVEGYILLELMNGEDIKASESDDLKELLKLIKA
jgi:DNA-binding FrmR family transcriptional regulator